MKTSADHVKIDVGTITEIQFKPSFYFDWSFICFSIEAHKFVEKDSKLDRSIPSTVVTCYFLRFQNLSFNFQLPVHWTWVKTGDSSYAIVSALWFCLGLAEKFSVGVLFEPQYLSATADHNNFMPAGCRGAPSSCAAGWSSSSWLVISPDCQRVKCEYLTWKLKVWICPSRIVKV